ncbi:hypothetical protein DK26_18175 [Bosea sp. WAO]|nr:hypothetical protein DK26_18175 [Bosea sp. WAO]
MDEAAVGTIAATGRVRAMVTGPDTGRARVMDTARATGRVPATARRGTTATGDTDSPGVSAGAVLVDTNRESPPFIASDTPSARDEQLLREAGLLPDRTPIDAVSRARIAPAASWRRLIAPIAELRADSWRMRLLLSLLPLLGIAGSPLRIGHFG